MRRGIIRAAVALSLAVAGLAGASQPALASVPCAGLLSGTVNDDVFVPPDANCFLVNATIHGSVVVSPSATLQLGGALFPDDQRNVIRGSVSGNPTMKAFTTFGTNAIGGNLVLDGLNGLPPESNGANLCGTTVGGNLLITNARPSANFVVIGGQQFACDGVSVAGNAIILGNNLPGGMCGDQPCPVHGVNIAISDIGGSLRVTRNLGGGSITGNTISGGLFCGGNTPPYVTSGNSVSGPNQAAGGLCH